MYTTIDTLQSILSLPWYVGVEQQKSENNPGHG